MRGGSACQRGLPALAAGQPARYTLPVTEQLRRPASVEELATTGRQLRKRQPRSGLGTGFRTDRDPVALLEAQNTTRLQSLVPVRWGRMAQSAFAFYRGAAALMAHDLAPTPVSGIRVQACGDAHLANFGFYASPERKLVFDLNDFDETLPAPWEWDVERLVASLAVAARSSGFGDEVAAKAAARTAGGYRRAMLRLAQRTALQNFHTVMSAAALLELAEQEKARAVSKEITRATRKAERRTSESALGKLATVTEEGELHLVEQPPFMVRPRQWPSDIAAVPQLYADSVSADIRALLRRFRPADMMLRVVGVGSVGTRCYLLAFEGPTGDTLFLQAKEAPASVLNSHGGRAVVIPGDESGREHTEGHRVVAAQRILQANSDPFLGWITGWAGEHEGRRRVDYYWRQFRDMKGSIEPESLDKAQFSAYGALCAALLARAPGPSPSAAHIAAYLGGGDQVAESVSAWVAAYADVAEADYRALERAVASGRVPAELGV